MASWRQHTLKRLFPKPVLDFRRRMLLSRLRRRNSCRTTQETFTEVYANNSWGTGRDPFCSGSGSTEQHAIQYAGLVCDFIARIGVSTVVDLGCGDFTIGRQIASCSQKYVGVDIVKQLVKHNQDVYGSNTVEFLCRDILVDPLPGGDLCLVRQVLQHLSNAQIVTVLNRVSIYPFVMVTEHYPAPSVKVIPNLDKPHGGDTRLYDNSAVYLDQPPFNVTGSILVLEAKAGTDIMAPGEILRTYLIDNTADNRAAAHDVFKARAGRS